MTSVVVQEVPTTAREALDLFEVTVSPRARTHMHFRTDEYGRLAIIAQRGPNTITLGWLSGVPGRWSAVDILNLDRGWTYARKTRTDAVEAMLSGEGCVITPAIKRIDDTLSLSIGGYVQATAWYSGDKRRWIVKVSGASVNHSEHTTRAAARDTLAAIARDRYGVFATLI